MEAVRAVKLVIPALNAPERVAFLSFVRAGAPAEAFEAILGFAARPPLVPAQYQALETALGA